MITKLILFYTSKINNSTFAYEKKILRVGNILTIVSIAFQ